LRFSGNTRPGSRGSNPGPGPPHLAWIGVDQGLVVVLTILNGADHAVFLFDTAPNPIVHGLLLFDTATNCADHGLILFDSAPNRADHGVILTDNARKGTDHGLTGTQTEMVLASKGSASLLASLLIPLLVSLSRIKQFFWSIGSHFSDA